ncbi:MAG: N-6 DNA methylase [Bacteroidota bacterium]|nr:N-6 DNA methylase [Bacteroidota bacterium]
MAKTKKGDNTSPKADIDFEQELWGAANELWGAVAENQHKDYVLSLLFAKHISERYAMRREELQKELNDPRSDYYTTSDKQLNLVMEDELEYQVKNVYKLPEEATWTYLKDNSTRDDIKVIVDKAFVLIDEILAKRNEEFKGVLEPIFVKSQLSPTQVSGLINMFSNDKFSEAKNPQSDIYGRVYEYYIGKFAQAEGSGAGQFFTPGSVVRLLVEMIEPMKGRIMDLACGSGGMFVQSLKFVTAHGGDKNDISIYGQERYEGTLRLCKMNLLLRNLSFDVKLGDSLLTDRFPTIKADFTLMNPPFNISKWHPEDLPENDPRLFGAKEQFATDGNANYMWFQTLWYHLSEKGTAGVVMANGAMTTGNQGEKNVREHMIENGMVDCINASNRDHPMHLHGFNYHVLSLGSVLTNSVFKPGYEPAVVTQTMLPQSTMNMKWFASRPGNWMFHCHLSFHVTPEIRLPGAAEPDPPDQQPHMAGLVIGIKINPGPSDLISKGEEQDFNLYANEYKPGNGQRNGFSFSPHFSPDTNTISTPGPLLLLKQYQATFVTVINNMSFSTSVHWHGLDLDSRADGVPDWSASEGKISPLIQPGEKFTYKLTLMRPGTYIYHSHMNDVHQIASGLYGPIIVLRGNEIYNPNRSLLCCRLEIFGDGLKIEREF